MIVMVHPLLHHKQRGPLVGGWIKKCTYKTTATSHDINTQVEPSKVFEYLELAAPQQVILPWLESKGPTRLVYNLSRVVCLPRQLELSNNNMGEMGVL